MAAYVIFIRDEPPHDAASFAAYQQANSENVAAYLPHGIKPIAVYGALTALEGPAPDGVIMLEFPTIEKAKAWYESPEYQAALPLRQAASDYRAFIVEGL